MALNPLLKAALKPPHSKRWRAGPASSHFANHLGLRRQSTAATALSPGTNGCALIHPSPKAVSRCACSTHSWWIISDTASAEAVPGRYPAHHNKVFVTDVPLPAAVKYEMLGKIDAGKVTTSNTEELLILIADKSRKIGANAVINLKVWRQPSGWSWNAPHGTGDAVSMADTNYLVGLTGYWY